MNRLTLSLMGVVLGAMPVFAQSTFEELTLTTTQAVPGPPADWLTIKVHIQQGGAVRVEQDYLIREVLVSPRVGQAPKYLMNPLTDALPFLDTIPSGELGDHALDGRRPFGISVRTAAGTKEIQGDADHLANKVFQLTMILDAVEDIREHVLQNGAKASDTSRELVEGVVRVHDGDVSVGSATITDRELATLMRNWNSQQVALDAQVRTSGGVRAIVSADILEPVRFRRIRRTLDFAADGQPLVEGAGDLTKPAFGRAASALVIGEGRSIEFDGYEFDDRFWIEAVYARVKYNIGSWKANDTIRLASVRGEYAQTTRSQRIRVSFLDPMLAEHMEEGSTGGPGFTGMIPNND